MNDKSNSKLAVNQTYMQPSSPVLSFKCDQCEYTNDAEKGLRQQIRMKYTISQLDGNEDIEIQDSDFENNPCPLFKDVSIICHIPSPQPACCPQPSILSHPFNPLHASQSLQRKLI